MTTVFIAGSITIKKIDDLIRDRIKNILDAGHKIIVGDADGADKAIQEHLSAQDCTNVTVYCSGDKPRNNLGSWPIEKVITDEKPGSRAFFTAKDLAMSKNADFGFMIWDTKSTGTLSNIIELMGHGKKSLVYVNTKKTFLGIGSPSQLDYLADIMPAASREKAEGKIRLSEKIAILKNQQSGFDF
ncbi:hypothetical protein WH216_05670 [Xanthomonas perforans]|uniref:hypothetical protein n=1 Tax=Xanthomonas TaxID=338 RepID=UPI001E308A81|nr:hypothetical protein [Xanthomonas vesicatoria]MCC8628536.1 hypothetical protein [Xanthomonas vesicatoria]MDG4483032.1 hypothetical protein [Xanthomonas vesicatoria]